MEHAHRVPAQGFGRHPQGVVLDLPYAAVRREGLHGHGTGVEGGRPQDVTGAAGDVAGLGVGRGPGLFLPVRIPLGNQAQLAVGLTVALNIDHNSLVGRPCLVGDGTGQIVQELEQVGLWGPPDGERAEGSVRNDVAVEFARPVRKPVTARVGDQDIPTRAAVSEVLVGGVGVRSPVCPIEGPVVVIGVEQVVAAASEELVLTGAAHQPVVAHIAEDHVIAVREGLQSVVEAG